MAEPGDTIRAAVIDRIRNPRSSPDNTGLAWFFGFLLGVVPVSIVITVCVTVYYILKLRR